ncbi:MAG: hypothetical protein IPP71_23465 [Bacteroidetes bacterium]|nr:hypothetical protein [Bacteroidota bacterium]
MLNFTFTNNSDDSQADHVFISIIPDSINSYLNGWHFYPQGSTVPLFLTDTIIPITTALGTNSNINGNLCAVVVQCEPTDTIPFTIHYGWNCGGYPTSPYDSTLVCGYDSLTLEIAQLDADLGSINGKTFESPYYLCDTIPLITCFQNSGYGYLYPYQVNLTNVHAGLPVVGGYVQSSTDTAHLIHVSGDTLFSISDSALNVLYPSTGGFNYDDGDFCVVLNILIECPFAGDSILPNIELFTTTFCNEPKITPVDYTQHPNFVMSDTLIVTPALYRKIRH